MDRRTRISNAHASDIVEVIQERPSGSGAALFDFDREVCIEQRILVHAVFRIATRIAQHSRSLQNVIETVVRMPVYP